MDLKTQDKILKVLLNRRDISNRISNPIKVIKEHFPKLETDVIQAALLALLEKDFILVDRPKFAINALPGGVTTYSDTLPLTQEEKLRYMEDQIEVVAVKAIGYLRRKQEEKINAIKVFAWETFKWLVPLLVGIYLGRKL